MGKAEKSEKWAGKRQARKTRKQAKVATKKMCPSVFRNISLRYFSLRFVIDHGGCGRLFFFVRDIFGGGKARNPGRATNELMFNYIKTAFELTKIVSQSLE